MWNQGSLATPLPSQQAGCCGQLQHCTNNDKNTKQIPIEFDENNVCYACKTVEKKWDGKIDWKEREKELIELCNKYKNFKKRRRINKGG